MAYTHPIIESLFLLTVFVLWTMIFYQLVFTFLGFIYRHRAMRGQRAADSLDEQELEPVSILIPAHNEAIVIEDSLRALLSLRYPKDRLEIIVINDGSIDATEAIVHRIGEEDRRVRVFNVPKEEAAQGKSHALNLGLREAHHNIIAVYDADNTPEPDSLRYLVHALKSNTKIVSTFGKFRTVNRRKNLLTRFINLETLSFQFMIQAGRSFLSKVAILPGTNFIIFKDVLEKCGGWDENALTEDTELSIRIYEKGHQIQFVPYSVTWEQEPEKWGTWLRQRTRWVRGNFYVLRKYLVPSFKFAQLRLTIELLYLFLLYYLFLGSILMSHVFFITSGLGLIAVLSPGPYFTVWVCAFLLFIAEITFAVYEDGEATPLNILIIALMYFTYCQGWLVLVFRALFQEYIQKGKVKWEKTRRFANAKNTTHTSE